MGYLLREMTKQVTIIFKATLIIQPILVKLSFSKFKVLKDAKFTFEYAEVNVCFIYSN